MSSPLRNAAWKVIKGLVNCQFSDIPRISSNELVNWLADDIRPPVLIDVRQREEYEISHLPNALHLPTVEAVQQADIPTDETLVLYCSVGYRSAQVARRLRENGYKNLMNLGGGIFEWYNQRHPVVADGQRVKQVHPYSQSWGMLLEESTR